MEKLEIKYIPIDGIKPYKNNPRLNEDNYNSWKSS